MRRLRFALVFACLAAGAGLALASSSTRSPVSLRWRPPRLVAPVRLTLPTTSDHLQLSPTQDYVLSLPRSGLVGTLWIEGGHNVVLIGGRVTVPASANDADNGADNTATGIYIKNATGTVHIEGVDIGAQRNVMFDGIDVNAPSAIVQIENVRISKLYGSRTSMHADAVQTWGGVRELRIDHLSVDGDYQGLTIAPDLGPVGSADIRNVDLTIDRVPRPLAARSVGGGHMIWLTRGATQCDAPRVVLRDVFLASRAPRAKWRRNAVWPQAGGTTLPCRARLRHGRLTWPSLPVSGWVTLGAPPNGPFVPAGSVGPDYRPPAHRG